MTGITAIILTRDEEKHLPRALASLDGIAERIFIVDSGSTDSTREIAHAAGATVLQKCWINYSTQFNWALDQLPSDTNWVLRLDADEFLTPELVAELLAELPRLPVDVEGIYLPRSMTFLGRLIRWGGIFPAPMLRIFRYRSGRCEERWMDEHIRVQGRTVAMRNLLIDDNLNCLTWWITKHNLYASREVVDLLNLELRFLPYETMADLNSDHQAGRKRWIKENIYARLPFGFRPLLYFTYRYFLRLGFLDGLPGLGFHLMQGLWYRMLVDLKLYEVKRYMRRSKVDPVTAVRIVLEIVI